MIRHLRELFDLARARERRTIAVAAAADAHVLQAVVRAQEMGLVEAILFGNPAEIRAVAEANGLTIGSCAIVPADSTTHAAELAVRAVNTGEAHALMKGNLATAELLSQVLNKDYGLRNGKEMLAHIAVSEVPTYPKLLAITDAAMNLTPDLPTKVSIINSAVQVMRALGVERPKVAIIAAVEVVNPAMIATVEAAQLSKMGDRGQIKNCLIDGPLALDNALSREAAAHKGIGGEVAGDADILILPDIEAGNVLYKSITYLAGGQNAGVIMGARCPVVLTSRSDSEDSKLYSIALSAIL